MPRDLSLEVKAIRMITDLSTLLLLAQQAVVVMLKGLVQETEKEPIAEAIKEDYMKTIEAEELQAQEETASPPTSVETETNSRPLLLTVVTQIEDPLPLTKATERVIRIVNLIKAQTEGLVIDLNLTLVVLTDFLEEVAVVERDKRLPIETETIKVLLQEDSEVVTTTTVEIIDKKEASVVATAEVMISNQEEDSEEVSEAEIEVVIEAASEVASEEAAEVAERTMMFPIDTLSMRI